MSFENYILLVNLAILVWFLVRKNSIKRFFRPSYQDLVAEKESLHESVVDWKYPDGTYVPQHKRQKMFRDLRRLSRKIREHPDNPGNKP